MGSDKDNLGQQLGEINGQLKQVLPVLERMEARQTKFGEDLVIATTNLQNTADRLQELRHSHGSKIAALGTENSALKEQVNAQKRDIDALLKSTNLKSRRGWEVLMLFLAGVLGAFLTWTLNRI